MRNANVYRITLNGSVAKCRKESSSLSLRGVNGVNDEAISGEARNHTAGSPRPHLRKGEGGGNDTNN